MILLNNIVVNEYLLKEAAEYRTIPFDNDVKRFKEAMEEKGHSLKTNFIPSEKISKGEELINIAKKMKTNLSKEIFGQDRAVNSVADSIKNNILENDNAPKTTYLFLGPPATGKTYLAELISKNLGNYKVLNLDMTQYSDDKGSFGLFGLERGFGSAMPGRLTSFVKKYEKTDIKTIIVLDEIEKAHYNTLIEFLEIFNTGFKRDACGWCKNSSELTPWDSDNNKCSNEEIDDIVDFRQTIFVITSNLGKELYLDNKFIDLIDDNKSQAESMILESLRREKRANSEDLAIPPELISRLSQSNIVLFNKLTYKAYEAIAKKAFVKYRDIFSKKFHIKFHLKNNFSDFLKIYILLFSPQLDARRIKAKIGVTFFDKITDYLMQLDEDLEYCEEIKISISSKAKTFLKENINDDIENEKLVRELFRKNLTLDIEEKLTEKDGVLTYKIEDCRFKQIKRISDFSEDGLVFDIPKISFRDIAGHKKAKTRLLEVIEYLKNPKLLKEFDIKVPKGMLLYGPPGTGKTLLAKAFANEADLPFIATTGTDLLDSKKTKSIFSKAKEYAPSIIFIDEIDALGKRGKGNNREIPINKLLSEVDGFSDDIDENIFVIAATNFKNNIDDAIIRPGRIELHISIDNLDKEAREYFIEKIIKSKPTSGKFDINKILMYTAGMTGAQLELIGKEASLYCLRHKLSSITQDILIEQINIIKYGEKITHISLEQMLHETAIHEAGHAILSKVLMPHIKIEQITVAPRESSLGFVSYNNEDMRNMTIKDFKDRICISLAGRASQVKKYGETEGLDTGASNDLLQATKTAYSAIANYGMDKEVGNININGIYAIQLKDTGKINANYYQEKIDKAIERWLQEGNEKTIQLVDKYWDKIEKLSNILLEKEVVYEDELELILKNK